MDRIQRSEQTYTRLFGPRDTTAPDPDPELGAILRRLIFGEVFHTGDLDDRTRELITVTVLTTMQTLPQLKAHTGAALNVGATPVQLREAVYQCAPFIGFPKTLNAVAVLNEVFTARGIDLPLPHQGTTTEEGRFEAGRAIQIPIYGDEIAESVAGLPDPFHEAVPRFLTAFGFGDFYTRDGLDVPTRELLILCLLAALGPGRPDQGPHHRQPPPRQHEVHPGRRTGPLLALHRVPAGPQRHPRHPRCPRPADHLTGPACPTSPPPDAASCWGVGSSSAAVRVPGCVDGGRGLAGCDVAA